MGFASLGSGSKGNGTLVALADQIFLVDCGFTLKQVENRLARLGLSGGDLSALFVTHEHSDHAGGVQALAHKYALPVYASYGTVRACLSGLKCHPFDGDVPFSVNKIAVNPVCVPHDAREPTQFVFRHADETIGVLSDLGCVTQHVIEQYAGCTHLLLEANHDRDMLMRGSYPARLKRRVGQDYGHLSNVQSAQFLQQICHRDLTVVIGHVSEQNNSRACLEQTFAPFMGRVEALHMATQQEGFGWLGRAPMMRQMSFAQDRPDIRVMDQAAYPLKDQVRGASG